MALMDFFTIIDNSCAQFLIRNNGVEPFNFDAHMSRYSSAREDSLCISLQLCIRCN